MLVTFATAKRNARGNYYFNDICSKLYENGKASSACTNTLAAGHTHRQNIYYMVVASFPFSLSLCQSLALNKWARNRTLWVCVYINIGWKSCKIRSDAYFNVLLECPNVCMRFERCSLMFSHLMHYFRSHANKSIDWIYSHTYEPCRFIWFSFACVYIVLSLREEEQHSFFF